MKNQQLKRGEVAALALKKGEAIRCEAGRLWLTFEGDGADYFLAMGQSRAAPCAGKAVVQALSEAASWNAVPVAPNPSPLRGNRLEWFPR